MSPNHPDPDYAVLAGRAAAAMIEAFAIAGFVSMAAVWTALKSGAL